MWEIQGENSSVKSRENVDRKACHRAENIQYGMRDRGINYAELSNRMLGKYYTTIGANILTAMEKPFSGRWGEVPDND